MSQIIHVAVAAIVNEQQEVLLSLRADDVHQGGLWEFPGGKLEKGEAVYDALLRELDEELGIHILQAQPLITVQHSYPDCTVVLDVWNVLEFKGEIQGREQQAIKWYPLDQLDAAVMPAADKPIIHALQLPDKYLITPTPSEDHAEFLQQIEASLKSGIRLLQLRAPALQASEYQRLAVEVQALTQRYNACLMINHSLQMFECIKADGLHLTASRL